MVPTLQENKDNGRNRPGSRNLIAVGSKRFRILHGDLAIRLPGFQAPSHVAVSSLMAPLGLIGSPPRPPAKGAPRPWRRLILALLGLGIFGRAGAAAASPSPVAGWERPQEMLAALAQKAAAHLREDQRPAGYWLTSYTSSVRFLFPRVEMNTFLTAMMVDMLDPVAAAAGLGANVARARRNLSEQIEANGLVRYSGRPDGPTIPFLGGVTSPDADDTALAWRIAAQDKDARLPGVLAVLKAYRTPDGLYRTWLAPRAQYVNIDPGQDPDPADVTIQMHVLLFLAKYDPAAARELHPALQRAIGEDRIWVYYKVTPLLPILRAGELGRLGYSLPLPPARLVALAPGQKIWVAACRALAREAEKAPPDRSGPEIPALLETLARDDFAAMRDAPPLLYHNDLTASVRRFYWSEDFGYALWLRLFAETAAPPPR